MNEWQVIESEFKKAFIDYAEHERENQELKELKMKDGNVDHYIVRFTPLAHWGGHDIDQPSILSMFAKGLPQNLSDKCLDLNDPETFDEWALAAQKNHKVWLKKRMIKGDYSATQTSTRQNSGWGQLGQLRWGNQNRGNQSWRGRGGRQGQNPRQLNRRDPDAMDTSAGVARKATTEAEKQKHRQEGRCYECSKQGHLARNCPDKKPRARATTSTKEDAPPNYD